MTDVKFVQIACCVVQGDSSPGLYALGDNGVVYWYGAGVEGDAQWIPVKGEIAEPRP